ncbi:MAG: cytidylate kinase-like family protein [Muribaculaceae bacterium]|nr:cytidylate kinase-like family protein [Muribaculaceae bacterium]
MTSPFVIVIGRQFGSGGRTIGNIVSRRLGINYYDTEILKRAAQKEGLDPDMLSRHEEKKPSILKALLQGAYGIPDNFHTVPISGERVYRIQSKIIKEIGERESCVIVGRNADFVLRDHPRLLSVFLHSPLSNRVERIMSRKEASTRDEAEEMARWHDRRRESYYNFYTGEKKWGVASTYHLCLDTSLLTNEKVADIIIEMAKEKFNI